MTEIIINIATSPYVFQNNILDMYVELDVEELKSGKNYEIRTFLWENFITLTPIGNVLSILD